MKLSKKQRFAFRNANRRINIWEGSIRSGKSFNMDLKWMHYVGREAPKTGELFMIGKTNETLYRNVIKPIQELIGTKNANYNIGRRILTMFGREISCLGANDESAYQKILGSTAAGILGDELTTWPESMFKESLGRMSLKGSLFFGSTNPDNPYHWLKKNWIDEQTNLDMAVFHFLLKDNHTLDKDYIENIKKEYKGIWYKRKILGLWVMAEGAIYDFFDEKIHIKRKDTLPQAQYYIASIDYGTKNPFACLLFGVNHKTKPRIWLDSTYYYDSKEHFKQKTDEQYRDDLKIFFESRGVRPQRVIIDPSAASFKLTMSNAGYWVVDADNDVENGLITQSRMLDNGDYVISDDPSNDPNIQEYYAYSWDQKKGMLGVDTPKKENDHCKDAERYAMQTLFGTKSTLLEALVQL